MNNNIYAIYSVSTMSEDNFPRSHFLLKQLNYFSWPLYFLTTDDESYDAEEKYLYYYKNKIGFLSWNDDVQAIFLECWEHPKKKFYILHKNEKFSMPYVIGRDEIFSMENDDAAILYFKINYNT